MCKVHMGINLHVLSEMSGDSVTRNMIVMLRVTEVVKGLG